MSVEEGSDVAAADEPRAARNAKASGRARDYSGLSREEATVQFARSGYDLDLHPAHLVRRVHQCATQQFQQVMEGDSLSPTQFAALATILKHGAISQNHLGRLTSMDPSTISVVVKKLIGNGLIKRRRSETDQRLSILTLDAKGQEYTLDRLKKSVEVGQRLLSPLTPEEQAVLMGLLVRLCDHDAAEPGPARGAVAPSRGKAAADA